mgnify:CR=1 FL=1
MRCEPLQCKHTQDTRASRFSERLGLEKADEDSHRFFRDSRGGCFFDWYANTFIQLHSVANEAFRFNNFPICASHGQVARQSTGNAAQIFDSFALLWDLKGREALSNLCQSDEKFAIRMELLLCKLVKSF